MLMNILIKLINYISDNFPCLKKVINKFAINKAINVSRYRPHPWSTIHPYTSWSSLTEKQWSARHLPIKILKPPKSKSSVIELFTRPTGKQRLCPKSTCLFPAFAQYLTDGIIRTSMPNKSKYEKDDPTRKQNTSNHNIDLSPLYGRTREQTLLLRLNSQKAGEVGKLDSQVKGGEEYAPFLFKNGKIKKKFDKLDKPLMLDKFLKNSNIISKVFAFGGDRANASPQVSMVNTLFLREHNRLAGKIEKSHPDWDDERVFETARNTNIVLFIKVIIEEYINHISPIYKFHTDPSVAWNAPWNKPNWITTEFSLLYRWHSLIPDKMRWGSVCYNVKDTIMNNELLLEQGLKQGFIDMSNQPAGQIGPLNTPQDLIHLETLAIDQGRLCQLASYSDYRKHFSLSRPSKFSDISSNSTVVDILNKSYSKVDDIEFYVGLFAEDTIPNSPLPPLIEKMVAVDAFSQALTNPLLSEHVWNEKTFSDIGWKTINKTSNIRELVNRNVKGGLSDDDFIGMTKKGWLPT